MNTIVKSIIITIDQFLEHLNDLQELCYTKLCIALSIDSIGKHTLLIIEL